MASIWFYALIYFFCYIPFGALSKAISSGALPGQDGVRVDGATLLPVSTLASIVVMVIFMVATGWWRYAHQVKVGGFSIPVPGIWTALSGVCTAVILATATLAYTFEGVSIVFVMLLMRGGVLVMAPLVDFMSRRQTHWYSWTGLVLSLGALLVSFSEKGGASAHLTVIAVVDILAYLLAYFFRLRFMSRLAKSDQAEATKRYFAEEQLVVAPFTLLMLGVFALIDYGPMMNAVRIGFTDWLSSGLVLWTAAIGTFSQLVGIFGTLVFLDKGENTFSVPVNRCSSVLSGVVASTALWLILDMKAPSAHELVGAGMVVAAIVVLSVAPGWTARRAKARAA